MLRVVARSRALARVPQPSIQRWRALHASSAAQALSKFTMPAMSPTMTEGGIAAWKKQEGEKFTAGDVLLEIETDKATMDVEAQEDGVLAKIIVEGGSKNVQVGSAIAITAEDAEDINDSDIQKALKDAENEPKPANEGESAKEEAAPAPKEEKKAEEPKKAESSAPKKESSSSVQPEQRDHIFASPIAKRLANERGIPLTQVKGTGPNGRIIKADIENFKPSAATAASGAAAAPSAGKGAAAPAEYTDIPLSNMRKVIASRLTESKQSTPHYYLTAEVKMDRVLKLRELFNSGANAKAAKDGSKPPMKLSVNDFVVKAASMALQDVPEANSAWMGEFIRQYSKTDIAIAVATPNGLITPIVTDVGAKGVGSISSSIKSLAAKARDGKLAPNEYQGGSFTISNLGMFGIDSFTAIINPPQSCILAVGATEQKLVLDETSEKGFKAINVMKVTLSADHRIVDGAVGARWMSAFKEALENPLTFML